MLTAEGISFAHGRKPVFSDVALSIGPGEVVGLGGASGSGKTTLGRILAGQLLPRSGRVLLNTRPLPLCGLPAPVQYAPQSAELAVDPRWSVARILSNGGPPDRCALDALGIRPDWSNRHPGELSGGELARVSLARLFHTGLHYLICDEVTSQIDALEQAKLLDGLRELAARRGIGLLLVSHSADLRRRYCQREVVLDVGVQGTSRPPPDPEVSASH